MTPGEVSESDMMSEVASTSGDMLSEGKKKGDFGGPPRKRRSKDGGPRFPVHYIKAQMKMLGCKKVSGTVPHMMSGILGCFCDEILAITNEAATAEVRIKKKKQGCTPRLTPSHMTYVKKHDDFKTLLANVHFRNVWQSSSTHNAAVTNEPPPADPNALLACEKQATKKKPTFTTRFQPHKSTIVRRAPVTATVQPRGNASPKSQARRSMPITGPTSGVASAGLSDAANRMKRIRTKGPEVVPPLPPSCQSSGLGRGAPVEYF